MSAQDDLPWDELYDRAERVIEATIDSLPPPIRTQARAMTTLLEKWPPAEDGDLLGQFHGFEPNHLSDTLGPLFIYLGPLHRYCQEENLEFDEEVRITYLHELGHHLGLDEDDLEERGLG